MKTKDNHINYIEFKAKDLKTIKEFYTQSFDWAFSDYGSTYTSFSQSGVKGGFEKTESEIVEYTATSSQPNARNHANLRPTRPSSH